MAPRDWLPYMLTTVASCCGHVTVLSVLGGGGGGGGGGGMSEGPYWDVMGKTSGANPPLSWH